MCMLIAQMQTNLYIFLDGRLHFDSCSNIGQGLFKRAAVLFSSPCMTVQEELLHDPHVRVGGGGRGGGVSVDMI